MLLQMGLCYYHLVQKVLSKKCLHGKCVDEKVIKQAARKTMRGKRYARMVNTWRKEAVDRSGNETICILHMHMHTSPIMKCLPKFLNIRTKLGRVMLHRV
jgi:hypothetical protein